LPSFHSHDDRGGFLEQPLELEVFEILVVVVGFAFELDLAAGFVGSLGGFSGFQILFVDEHVEQFVFSLDGRESFGHGSLGFADDDGDQVALPENLGARPLFIQGAGNVDALDLFGRAGVNRFDFAVRVRAAQHAGQEHLFRVDVIAVFGRAGALGRGIHFVVVAAEHRGLATIRPGIFNCHCELLSPLRGPPE
jgi:hypothetical protein